MNEYFQNIHILYIFDQFLMFLTVFIQFTALKRNLIMKSAIVTGASKGIGFAICRKLIKSGYKVYGLYSGTTTTEQNIAQMKEIGIFPMQADVSDAGSVDNVFSAILSRENKIDCLVNNAGISYIGLLQDMSVEDWDKVLHTNLRSVFLCSRAVLKNMLHYHEGTIINISSMWGEQGASTEVAYSASKGGVNSFTKALAKEVGPSGIRVNALSLGAIETSMNHFLSPEEKEELEASIDLGRFGSPEEVAKAVLFLAEDATYMSGSILSMDGGF